MTTDDRHRPAMRSRVAPIWMGLTVLLLLGVGSASADAATTVLAAASLPEDGAVDTLASKGEESICHVQIDPAQDNQTAPCVAQIVVLRPAVDLNQAARLAARRYGLLVTRRYGHALNGFAALVPADQVAALRADPSVAYVQADRKLAVPGEQGAMSADATTAARLQPQDCLRDSARAGDPAQWLECEMGVMSPSALQRDSAASADSPRPRGGGVSATAAVPDCAPAEYDSRCPAWIARSGLNSGNTFEIPTGIAASPTGDRVFTIGYGAATSHPDLPGDVANRGVVMAHKASTGEPLWVVQAFADAAEGFGTDAPNDVAVSPDGSRVYITGFARADETGQTDIRVDALDAATGRLLWDARYDRSSFSDEGLHVVVSPDGRRVYTSGYSVDVGNPVDNRGVVLAHDAATGREEWVIERRVGVNQIAVRGGRVYATGWTYRPTSLVDFENATATTSAYDAETGALLWESNFDDGAGGVGFDVGRAVAASSNGEFVYITGYDTALDGKTSFLTVGYAAADGRQVWARRHAGDGPPANTGRAIAVSPTGDRVYATGVTTTTDLYFTPTTLSYDAATGATAWSHAYAPQPNAGGAKAGGQTRAVTVSPDGTRVMVNGFYSNDADGLDALTLVLSAANGGAHWVGRRNSEPDATACLGQDFAAYSSVSADGHRLYAASQSFSHDPQDSWDMETLAYDTAGGETVPVGDATEVQPRCPQVLPWGVDRVDADTSFTKAGDRTGDVRGVNAYVIDTGLDRTNVDLNVVEAVNFAGGDDADCDGHGTYVGGVIGARDNSLGVVGVAPGVPLTSVKVADCQLGGSVSSLIAGIDWVTQNAARPAVASIALFTDADPALDEAVKNSADTGIVYAVAAGDGRRGPSCSNFSPAAAGAHPGVMTTGATTRAGEEISVSAAGPCVDVWAPGDGSPATAVGGGVTFHSGTTAASPHAAGAAALYLALHPQATVAEVEQALKDTAEDTGFSSKDADASPVKQVYVGGLLGDPGPAVFDEHWARQWGPQQVRAPQAWSTSTGAGQVISVVDTGVDLSHPDLQGKLVAGATFAGCPEASCGNGDWDTGKDAGAPHPHGTHVAGIAAAATDNGIGIAGVAPDAKIMPVKVLGEEGGSFEEIAAGIRWSTDNGADVINMSLGALPGVQALEITGLISDTRDAIAYANSKGVVVVIAAGNETSPLCASPAFNDGALCVTATDRNEVKAWYSNLGVKPDLRAVAAPGGQGALNCSEDILSTVPVGAEGVCGGSTPGYDAYAGTSTATPHVAGVAALLTAQGRDNAATYDVLMRTARTPGSSVRGVYDPVYGYGIVDAEAAVSYAAGSKGESPPETCPRSKGAEGNHVVGTPGNDILEGTPGPDVICGLGGNDSIAARGGDDVIRGGRGIDLARGGSGNDSISAGGGKDDARGGAGDDDMFGQTGDDSMLGGGGRDAIEGNKGLDTLHGNRHDDTLEGGDGDDLLNGNQGDDTLRGGDHDDDLNGGRGSDACRGGGGRDTERNCE